MDENVSLISRKRIEGLYPGLRPLVYRVLNDVYQSTKLKLGIAQGFRSFEDQAAVYAKGRDDLGDGKWVIADRRKIVTNAKPGLSWHCYGLAFDTAWEGKDPYLQKLSKEERALLWSTFGKVGKSHGFKWGGDFHLVNGVEDLPHLEMAYGLTIPQTLELFQAGGIPAVWAYLDKHRGVEIQEGWKTRV